MVYDLVHCTSHEKGFTLFKSTAWKTFDDRSSGKNRHGEENQLTFDFLGGNIYKPIEDEYCYDMNSIASYVQKNFCGRKNVPLEDIWNLLKKHPVFPTDGYKVKIKNILKHDFGAKITKYQIERITFTDRKG